MDIDISLWKVVKNKTLDEVIGYSYDVKKLVTEIKRYDINKKLTDKQITAAAKHLIKLANNILGNVEENKTINLKPHEMRDLLPYFNQEHDPIYITGKEADKLISQLNQHPQTDNFALLNHHFILNRRNIRKLFDLMGNKIDIKTKKLQALHQTLADIRDEVDHDDYLYFFGSDNQHRSEKRLNAYFNYIFGMNYSGKLPVTHNQLWRFIRVATPRATLRIFGKPKILETDDIDLNNINWTIFLDKVALHNQHNPNDEVLFDLEPYQNRRIIANLPFEQALEYENMFINKFAGVSEKTFSTGSKAMVALGHATKTMQILSGLADILIKAAVFIKSFLIMPILAMVLIIAGRKSHIDKVKEEQYQHKHFLLNAVKINELRKNISQEKQRIIELNHKHFNDQINIDAKLKSNPRKLKLTDDLPSEFRTELNKPFKARFKSKMRALKIKWDKIKKKIVPFLGPLFAGALTGAGLFIIGLFFSHYLPFVIGLAIGAALIGVLNIVFRVKTDRHEKSVREILDRSEKNVSNLTHELNQHLKLKNTLLAKIDAKTPLVATQRLNILTPGKNNQLKPLSLIVSTSKNINQPLHQENAKLHTQVALLTKQRDQLLKQLGSGATKPVATNTQPVLHAK